MCFSPQRRTIFRHLNFKKCSKHLMFWAFSRPHLRFATAVCHFSTSERTKVLQTPHVLCIFISTRAFRHSGVHFFDGRRAKSASELTCFVHFHFKMCFSPQRRAFFRQENSKKCFGPDVFCTFSLQNVFFATVACNFWCLLSAPTSAPAALTGLLLDWPDTRIIEKTAFRDFSNIWRGCIFFLLTFALLHLLSADLTTLLCFSTVHIVGSFYLNFLRLYTNIICCLGKVLLRMFI